MEQLILLGQIPGTSIHITFGSWLCMAIGALLAVGVTYDRTHEQRILLSVIYLSLRLNKRKMLKQFDRIAL